MNSRKPNFSNSTIGLKVPTKFALGIKLYLDSCAKFFEAPIRAHEPCDSKISVIWKCRDVISMLCQFVFDLEIYTKIVHPPYSKIIFISVSNMKILALCKGYLNWKYHHYITFFTLGAGLELFMNFFTAGPQKANIYKSIKKNLSNSRAQEQFDLERKLFEQISTQEEDDEL